MPAAYKVRAMLAGLTLLGEPSSLAGVDCGHATIQRNAQLFAGIGDTADDNHVVRYIVASLAATAAGADILLGLSEGTTTGYDPKVGQTLVHPDGTFKLDRLLDDNGIVRRFIVAAA
jgi:hypothetical protein